MELTTDLREEITRQLEYFPRGVVNTRELAYRVDTVLQMGGVEFDELEGACVDCLRSGGHENHCLSDDFEHEAHPEYDGDEVTEHNVPVEQQFLPVLEPEGPLVSTRAEEEDVPLAKVLPFRPRDRAESTS